MLRVSSFVLAAVLGGTLATAPPANARPPHGGGGGGHHYSGGGVHRSGGGVHYSGGHPYSGGGHYYSGGARYYGGSRYYHDGGHFYSRPSVFLGFGLGYGLGVGYGRSYGYRYAYPTYYDSDYYSGGVPYYGDTYSEAPSPYYSDVPGGYEEAEPLPSAPPSESSETRIRVILPDPQAEVWVDGHRSSNTGATRTFGFPEETAGRAYQHKVTVRMPGGDRSVTDEREVRVEGGSSAVVDFTRAAPRTQMPPAEPREERR